MPKLALVPTTTVQPNASACLDGDCYEGRCLWCALFMIREYAVFAYLASTTTPTNTSHQSLWCGA